MVSFKYGYNPIALEDLPSPNRHSRSGSIFSSQEYWQQRFSKDCGPFDWLVPARVLCDFSIQFLGETTLKSADILHIGCGTSESTALRDLVSRPQQVHNIDFSESAIRQGWEREEDRIARNKAPVVEHDPQDRPKHDSIHEIPPASQYMRWSCLDLRSLDATLQLLQNQLQTGKLFDVVLDKATSDSISSGPSVRVDLPYRIQRWARSNTSFSTGADVHPMNVLAVHLAALTAPQTGRWLVISNSMDRFPFLPPFAQGVSDGRLPKEVVAGGFPDPRTLWVLEAKEEIETRRTETLAQLKTRLQSGRQMPNPYLYVLRRTSVVVTD